jgi:adenine-specific DNA-methyltransferase
MQKTVRDIIRSIQHDEIMLNKVIVTMFIRANALEGLKNRLLRDLFLDTTKVSALFIMEFPTSFSLDEVIEAFELGVPDKEKVLNGAIYTPGYIKDFIIEETLAKVQGDLSGILAADISCGCGGFLCSMAMHLKERTGQSYTKIFKSRLFGLDISATSIDRTKILLSLLAVKQGEDKASFDFNLYVGNALSFSWGNYSQVVKKNGGFDVVVGNPPYVRAKNIDKASRRLLNNWVVTESGNPDLYIPFFEIGLHALNSEGVLGYITVNSFYKSVNARALRSFLHERKYSISIIDFGHEKIFQGKSAYTCICLIRKTIAQSISFKKETGASIIKGSKKPYNSIPYRQLNDAKGWLLNDRQVLNNIEKIENIGLSFGDAFKIRNGIATLSNDTYIFKPVKETLTHYVLQQGTRLYPIEKGICRDIIKPNILKEENQIEKVKEKLIFPYTNGTTPLTLMSLKKMQGDFPNALKYLKDNKAKLMNRDKGAGDYDAWYAFGRTQALTDYGYKLLFPYIAKKPSFVFTDKKDMLIYCGYAVFNESAKELQVLKRILESKVFDYYIKHTSKPYSAGFVSYAKNYVKNFGICPLTTSEKDLLLNVLNRKEIDEFLIGKYNIAV